MCKRNYSTRKRFLRMRHCVMSHDLSWLKIYFLTSLLADNQNVSMPNLPNRFEDGCIKKGISLSFLPWCVIISSFFKCQHTQHESSFSFSLRLSIFCFARHCDITHSDLWLTCLLCLFHLILSNPNLYFPTTSLFLLILLSLVWSPPL